MRLYYSITLFSGTNQLEDPRAQWRQEQQAMLKDYLVIANEDLEVLHSCLSHFILAYSADTLYCVLTEYRTMQIFNFHRLCRIGYGYITF